MLDEQEHGADDGDWFVISAAKPPRLFGPFPDIYAANGFLIDHTIGVGGWSVVLERTRRPVVEYDYRCRRHCGCEAPTGPDKCRFCEGPIDVYWRNPASRWTKVSAHRLSSLSPLGPLGLGDNPK